ncbi:MAG TPA: hypothetical protein DCL38_05515 [Lachnospiraceae bacterium]|nr:hypothetical protein [Lachnospiraceae bacterium]
MNKFFNPDNPVTVILSRCFDLIVLNLCFIIGCLPLFTAGASLTALFRVALSMAEGDFGYTVPTFIASFKKNLRQSVPLFLCLLSLTVFLLADLYVIFFMLPEGLRLLQAPVWLLLFADLSVIIYAFPMLARYEQKSLRLIKNSLLLGISNLPLTVSVIVISAVLADLSLHNGSLLVLFFSLFLFIGFALSARILSVFLIRIFNKAGISGS